MDICLLGMVFSEKCVDIFEICFEFLVIMMNCIIVRIRKIIRLIIKLLFMIKLLKVLMI